jgi:AcrR family transcriptional regulator
VVRPPSGGVPPPTATVSGPLEEGRERILDAASRHFFTHGISMVTMDDLARELGMSKKTLYTHFRAKEELLDAVLDRRAARIRLLLQRVAHDPHLSFAAKIHAVGAEIAALLSDIKPSFLHSLQRHAPVHFQKVEEMRRSNLQRFFTTMIRDGQRLGLVRPDADPEFTVELLLNALMLLQKTELLERHKITPGQAVQRILLFFHTGMLTEKGKLEYESIG